MWPVLANVSVEQKQTNLGNQSLEREVLNRHTGKEELRSEAGRGMAKVGR
jgi:hypothetical protein